MKKFLLVAAAVALVGLTGCEQATETKTVTNTVVQKHKVGDELFGDYVVTYVDAKDTGYIAIRAASDKSGDGDIRDAGEGVSGQVTGTFTADITLTKLADAKYIPTAVAADTTKYTAGTDNKITWILNGPVFIGQDNANSATLTVESGALITASGSAAAPGMLVISRGSKIMAEGSATDPIVFTSSRLKGFRAAGDWGGLIINGNAPINDGDDNDATKAGGSAEGEGNTGKYGGTDAADNSGVLKYVRIEFGGVLFTADNELNGLALQGVGSGTTLSYIQIHQAADDGIEFFGGSVNVDHLVLTGAQDDSLDWTSGWNGKAQYVIAQQYSVADVGIEADNKENGVNNLPRSNPTLANLTFIGKGPTWVDDKGTKTYKAGALFRRGTDVTMLNSLFANFKTSLDVTHSSGDANTTVFKGVFTTEALDGTVASYVSGENNNLKGADLASANLPAELTDATYGNETTFKFTAVPTGYTASTDAAAANYLGAIDPAGTDWTIGWITTAQN